MHRKSKFTSLRISVLVLCIASLIVFVGNGEIGTNTPSEPSEYVVRAGDKVVCEGTAEQVRACDYMNKMASVPWSIPEGESLRYKSGASLTGGNYRGLPYTQEFRDCPDFSEDVVQKGIDEAIDGKSDIKGVDCSSAVSYAWRFAAGVDKKDDTFLKGRESAYTVASFLYDSMSASEGTTPRGSIYRDNVDKVGNYGKYEDYGKVEYTDKIIEHLSDRNCYSQGDLYDNVYSRMQPGDALLTYRKEKEIVGHIIMVTDVFLEYDGDGIDEENSWVYIIDQNSPGITVTSEYRSSWRVRHPISFKELKDKNYIPVRLNK